jgi:hypothetical protein
MSLKHRLQRLQRRAAEPSASTVESNGLLPHIADRDREVFARTWTALKGLPLEQRTQHWKQTGEPAVRAALAGQPAQAVDALLAEVWDYLGFQQEEYTPWWAQPKPATPPMPEEAEAERQRGEELLRQHRQLLRQER